MKRSYFQKILLFFSLIFILWQYSKLFLFHFKISQRLKSLDFISFNFLLNSHSNPQNFIFFIDRSIFSNLSCWAALLQNCFHLVYFTGKKKEWFVTPKLKNFSNFYLIAPENFSWEAKCSLFCCLFLSLALILMFSLFVISQRENFITCSLYVKIRNHKNPRFDYVDANLWES